MRAKHKKCFITPQILFARITQVALSSSYTNAQSETFAGKNIQPFADVPLAAASEDGA